MLLRLRLCRSPAGALRPPPPTQLPADGSFYAGQPPLNRLSFQRQAAAVLNAYLPSARFIVFDLGRVLCPPGQYDTPYYLSLEQVRPLVGAGFEEPPEGSDADGTKATKAAKARQAARPVGAPALVFLGIDERGFERENAHAHALERPKGTPYFAIDSSGTGFAQPKQDKGKGPKGEAGGEGEGEVGGEAGGEAGGEGEAGVVGSWGDARASGGAMGAFDAGVFATGRALADWNGRNRHCAACGARTYSLWGGWKRACASALSDPGACFSNTGLHNFAYPRTDAVTIMGVLDAGGGRMLLGRQRAWPAGLYSCLAGFIEPGESFEDAVRREVLEEAGVRVGPVRYASSQPWPFPANIMVGCYARALSDDIRLDLDNELEDAQWFPRAVVARLFDNERATHLSRKDYSAIDHALTAGDEDAKAVHGDLAQRLTKIPPETAIAGKLIRQWALGPPAVDLVSRL